MNKEYLSPGIKVVSIESTPILFSTSGSATNINEVNIDGNNQEITDGGTTNPDEDYAPW